MFKILLWGRVKIGDLRKEIEDLWPSIYFIVLFLILKSQEVCFYYVTYPWILLVKRVNNKLKVAHFLERPYQFDLDL